ncbi:methyltransferase [Micromonospora rifamycinica]|uniref:O-methyltransferase n=1 Tax=Micromonospora rifamycinica TaxID=291594 RepID=A0A1C5HMG5_9ACTN|nr:methyltransferase [Micromonospora rifamycinica]SCG47107.1 O-methyltransferase [Micromonospora rifamycinica]
MSATVTLNRFTDFMAGPARFMTLLSCFELGLIDALRQRGSQTAVQLGDAADVRPAAVEQLLLLLVKEGFVAHDETTGEYTLDALAEVPEADLRRVLLLMDMIKVTMLRQVFYLTDSVRTGTVVGLEKLYGFQGGTLYDAVAEHPDLRASWATLMDNVTAHIDPWFFDNIDIPPGARVLDVAGNTGLGAILTHKLKGSPGLHVTTFDLPEKEAEALENFRSHGLERQCSFVGGDVFTGLPAGHDVVLIKHFLDMWDKDAVRAILQGVSRSLEVGGQVHILVPVYPESVRDSTAVDIDFFPAFFLGCTMGQGGPQRSSTYRALLEECGFTVTRTVAQDPARLLPGTFVVHGILSATKHA